MRAIHLANSNKRDAEVGLEARPERRPVALVLPDGGEPVQVKFLKCTADTDSLLRAHDNDLLAAGAALMAGDPEVDIERVGRPLRRTHKLYVNQEGNIAYRVSLVQVVRNADGSERERRDLAKAASNVSAEIPIQWSGRLFPKAKALRQFVFTRAYQIRHTSGLSYDFLYEMAKTLAEADALMFVGAGKKGNEPIVLNTGGEPYRGFLEGRVRGDTYCLVLHLTNIELKALPAPAAQES